MAVAFATPVTRGGQPTVPKFRTVVTITFVAADTYATGGFAVPAALGSSWQNAVGAGRTIRSIHARGIAVTSGDSDGLLWHANLVTNKLMAYESGGANVPMAEKGNAEAFAADGRVEVTIESD